MEANEEEEEALKKSSSSEKKLSTEMSDRDNVSTSTERLLQTFLSAIRSTNDIISECNNNRTVSANGRSSSDILSKSQETSAPNAASDREGNGPTTPPPPPLPLLERHPARWKTDRQLVAGEGPFSELILPPPVDFDGIVEFSYDSMVLPPPPHVFIGREETHRDEETVSKAMVSDGAVSTATSHSLDSNRIRSFPNAERRERKEESSGGIVGGIFSVRQVCSLFETDQMHVVREALDVEPVEKARSSGAPLVQGESQTVDVAMTTFKGSENRSNAKTEFAERFLKSEKQDLHPEVLKLSSSCVPKDIEKNIFRREEGLIGQQSGQKDSGGSDSNTFTVCRVNKWLTDYRRPDPDKKLPDPNRKSPHSNKKTAVSVLSDVDSEATGAAKGSLPTTAKGIGEGEGGARRDREGPTPAAAAAAVDFNSDGNLMPVDCVEFRPTAAESDDGGAKENPESIRVEENHTKKKPGSGGGGGGGGGAENVNSDSKQSLPLTLSTQGNSQRRNPPSLDDDQCRVQLLYVDVSKSVERSDDERHFVSRTLTKTVTQESRTSSAAAAAVAMAADPTANAKAGGAYAAQLKNSGGENNVLKELEDRRLTTEETESGKGSSRSKEERSEEEGNLAGDLGKAKRSVFDSLLDENESDKSDKQRFSVFEQRKVTQIQIETKSNGGKTVSHDVEVKSTSVLENSAAAQETEDLSNGHSTVSVNETKEERNEDFRHLPRLSRPTNPQTKPEHGTSSASVRSSPGTSWSLQKKIRAPLATPEESLEDAPPCAHRGRHSSSVGPSRSRQSSVGRSRHGSVSSFLAFQLPPSSGVSTHFVVVAIDFGTTYSGYAFSFTRDPDSIHMMRRWEGGDPGIVNQKTPTTLLLTPDAKFHSFGFAARDFYHDLDTQEAKKWLYFEKFKMALHHNADLSKETTLKAANGKTHSALSVFSHALRFFRDHALQELSDQSSTTIINEDIRWVLTVPAIWKAPAKQFMRQAAYQAGIASPDDPNQLMIALEPEAASIYVRKLRLYQLMPDPATNQQLKRESTPDSVVRGRTTDDNDEEDNEEDEYASPNSVKYKTLPPPPSPSFRHSISPTSNTASVGEEVDIEGTNYMVVDCGGGTVDITVYEMESGCGQLKELHKATGGPYGSLGIDFEFEKLLIGIFGSEFIEAFRTKRPAGWVDLMVAFESRKRTANPFKNNPLNVSLPFSFIDYYKKFKGSQVENAIRKYGNKEITWSSQGMLRLTMTMMRRLFQPTLDHIKQAVGDVLNNPNARDIKYMFLVGGFAESAILQMEMRKEFDHILKILIPQDVGLTILKGAVCFGLDPSVVSVRRCRMTYGVGVLNRFIPDKHPRSKMITKEGVQWCTDVFDKFVEVDQSVAIGETVVRGYTPAKAGQKSTIIHIYCAEIPNPQYITDAGVKRCGTLCLDLTDLQYLHTQKPRRREIQASMTFGDTEIKVTALDVATGKYVRAAIDFMSK